MLVCMNNVNDMADMFYGDGLMRKENHLLNIQGLLCSTELVICWRRFEKR